MSRKPIQWHAAGRALQTLAPPPARGADAFWQEFHARRVLRHQQVPLVPEARMFALLLPALVAAGVAVLLVSGLLLARVRFRPEAACTGIAVTQGPGAVLLTDALTPARIPAVRSMELDDEEDAI